MTDQYPPEIQMSLQEARDAGYMFPAEVARRCNISRRRVMNLLEQNRMDPFVWTEGGRMISPQAVIAYKQRQEQYAAQREPVNAEV